MTTIIVAQDAPVLVAIDIAKARHEVLIAVPNKKRRRRLTVLNELDDFTRDARAKPKRSDNFTFLPSLRSPKSGPLHPQSLAGGKLLALGVRCYFPTG